MPPCFYGILASAKNLPPLAGLWVLEGARIPGAHAAGLLPAAPAGLEHGPAR
jgi:hypothetical protein